MIRLIPAIIIMLYYWLFRIKSYGKLPKYSTESVGDGVDGAVDYRIWPSIF
jgi:hypothetical protein